jgi:hypothetical protein
LSILAAAGLIKKQLLFGLVGLRSWGARRAPPMLLIPKENATYERGMQSDFVADSQTFCYWVFGSDKTGSFLFVEYILIVVD